ncbi:MAG: hypothetical protein HKN18_17895 [Silicimonas sp.]|nr:hypothetical protein [Silicimonas sp.]
MILEQSIDPFKGYVPAPFSTGRPGLKEYAFYSASHELVAVARVVEGNWTMCYLRETKEERARARSLAVAWAAGLADAFPKPGYLWGKNIDPNIVQPSALRCIDDRFLLMIFGYFSDHAIGISEREKIDGSRVVRGGQRRFRVAVTKGSPGQFANVCQKEES